MRRYPLVVFALLTLWMVGDHPAAAQNPGDNCPPHYRKDPAATARAREAVWAVEQKFNQSRYTEAFAAHTRKNVEAAGQQWTRQAEDVIRKVSPNRWQDIVKVLAGAGMPVPQ